MAHLGRQQRSLLCFTGAATLVGGWVLGYRIVLLYDTPASFFLWTGPFLRQWLDRPGGLLLYAGAFLHQFYHYVWAGALLGAGMTAACGLLLAFVRRRLFGWDDLFHTLAPAVVLLTLHALSTLTVGYTLAAVALALYAAPPPGRWRRLAVGCTVPLLYLVAGVHVWLYVLWVAVCTWRERATGRSAFLLGLAGLAVLTPLAAWRLLGAVTAYSAFLAPWRWPQSPVEWAALLYLLPAPLLPPLSSLASLHRRWAEHGRLPAEVALLVLLGVVLTAWVYQPGLRRLAQYQRYYQAQDWAAIVALADEDARDHGRPAGPQDASQAVRQCLVNHALGRQGRLLEAMFRYPQPWGTWGLVLNFPAGADQVRWAMYNSDLFLALGHTNAAYRWAYNQSTVLGPTYANTHRLAVCSLIDGNDDIAAKYAAILARTLFHRREAADLRGLLADPEQTARRYAALRRCRPQIEVDVALGEVGALLALVASNPDNRLAVDYLVAWCLLDKQALPLAIDQVAHNLNRHYARVPVHCQEALLLFAAPEPGASAEVERLCSPAVLQQYAGARDVLAGAGRGEVGRQAAARVPGGTYWSYFVLQQVPAAAVPVNSWQRLAAEFEAVGAARLAGLLSAQAVARGGAR
jgi:hypothetical protein